MIGGVAAMRPDWVMLGVDRGAEGVMVFASSNLSIAELRVIVNEPVDFGYELLRRFDPSDRYFELETTMHDYVFVVGPDYATALRTLLGRWQPERGRQTALPSQPGLPSGG
jgi:hypothetical protein